MTTKMKNVLPCMFISGMDKWEEVDYSDDELSCLPPSTSSREVKHDRVIIHVDIDCFYAQVEMILNPSLRGKPLGIQQKNILVTCNYEARALGVKKLMLLKDAKLLCPNLTIVNGEDLKKYREASERIYEILRSFSPLVEKLGLDENFIDVTDRIKSATEDAVEAKMVGHLYQSDKTDKCSCGCKSRLTTGSRLAQEMRDRLKTDLGITSCAGVAHNKLLAKLAAGIHKPNQQTTVFPSSSLDLIGSLGSPRQLPGIGSSTFRKLEELGIQTISQLQELDIRQMERAFGEKLARHIKELSFGIDASPVKITERPKSIGAEDGFPTVRTIAEIRVKMKLLLGRVWDLVMKDGRVPSQVKLTVRKVVQQGQPSIRESRQTALDIGPSGSHQTALNPSQEEKMMAVLMNLFGKLTSVPSWQVTLLGISFAGLADRGCASAKNSIQKFFCSASTSSKTDSSTDDCPEPPAKRTRQDNDKPPLTCPEGADPFVFSQLPLDIQKELVNAARIPSSTGAIQSTQPKSKTKPTQNLLKYFRKL